MKLGQKKKRISLIRTDFSNQLESMKSKIDELSEKVTSMMPKQKEKKITSPLISVRFSGSSNRNGLISMLGDGVTLSATQSQTSRVIITIIFTTIMAANLSQDQTRSLNLILDVQEESICILILFVQIVVVNPMSILSHGEY